MSGGGARGWEGCAAGPLVLRLLVAVVGWEGRVGRCWRRWPACPAPPVHVLPLPRTHILRWTPYGPGTTLEDPAVVSSAYYAVDRKKPEVAAALAAAPPQASSVVTSTKITIDMGINQANSLSPELVELQHAAISRATNGSMFPSALPASADNSPQSFTTVLKSVTAATLSACKAYSSCNDVYAGTRNAIGTVTGPVCGEGVFGAVLNLAVGSLAGQAKALGTALGSASAMLPDFCPNAPTGLDALIAIAGWVRLCG